MDSNKLYNLIDIEEKHSLLIEKKFKDYFFTQFFLFIYFILILHEKYNIDFVLTSQQDEKKEHLYFEIKIVNKDYIDYINDNIYYLDFTQLVMNPSLFKIDDNILFNSPYVSIYLDFNNQIRFNPHLKNYHNSFSFVSLDASLNWIDPLLFAMDKTQFTAEIKHLLFNCIIDDKGSGDNQQKTNKI